MTLSEWASIAEIIGVILVVISLTFVALNIKHNTDALSGENDGAMFDVLREIGLVVLQDEALSSIIERGRNDPTSLSSIEERRYMDWLSLHIDNWVRCIRREQKGLIRSDQTLNWHEYYEDFVKKSITSDQWQKLNWEWGSHSIVKRVDELINID